MFRCIINEGDKYGERVLAADTRKELDEMVLNADLRGEIRTKRFFKLKDHPTSDGKER